MRRDPYPDSRYLGNDGLERQGLELAKEASCRDRSGAQCSAGGRAARRRTACPYLFSTLDSSPTVANRALIDCLPIPHLVMCPAWKAEIATKPYIFRSAPEGSSSLILRRGGKDDVGRLVWPWSSEL